MPTATWSNEPTTPVTTDTLTLQVTFDEPISGFAAGDLRLRRTSDNRNYLPTAAQTTLTDLGSNVWQVEIADLETLLGEQDTEFLLRLRSRSVFFETSQQNGPNGARDSASFSLDTTPQPISVAIAPIAHQRVTIGTEMALDINITGNPDDAYIYGLLEGFYTNWNDPILEVRGAATRLISNSQFTVYAIRGTEDVVTSKGIFSVTPAAPVITNPGSLSFIRGVENEQIVRISNSPAVVRAEMPWVGIKYEPHPQGIRLFGEVPLDTNANLAIPSAEQVIDILAQTGQLTDTVQVAFSLTTGSAPRWRNIPDGSGYVREIGQTFSLNLPSYALGTPTPEITLLSGTIPPGLVLSSSDWLSGSFTAAGVYAPIFRATNGAGHADSEAVNFTVYDAFAAPAYISNTAESWIADASTDTFDVSSWFTQGKPPGRYSVQLFEYNPSEGYFEVNISSIGIISFSTSNPPQDGDRMSARVSLTNSEGIAQSDTFDIEIDYS